MSQLAVLEDLGSQVRTHGDPNKRLMEYQTDGKHFRSWLLYEKIMGRKTPSSDQYLGIKSNFSWTVKQADSKDPDNEIDV